MNYQFKDPVSGLTHAAGAILGFVGMLLLLYKVLPDGNLIKVISSVVFGIGLVLLYTSSACYHLVNVPEGNRSLYRKIDHAMIFLLIAASYTPFCLIPLRGIWGWSILTVIWGLTVAGMIVSIVWRESPDWLRVALYLFMGWLVLIVIFPLFRALNSQTIFWLCVGGAFYTVGAFIYALKWPDPLPDVFGFHEIWHLFVLGGSGSHFVAVYLIL